MKTIDEVFDECIKEFSPTYAIREKTRLDLLFGEQDLMILISYIPKDDLVVYTILTCSTNEMLVADWSISEDFIKNFKKCLEANK